MTPATQARVSLIARIAAAVLGGYALTYFITGAIAVVMLALDPSSPSRAVLGATEVSFIIWTAAIMTVFHVRSVIWAWAGVSLACLPPAIIMIALSP